MTSETGINPAEATVQWIERRPWLTLGLIAVLLAVQITPKLTMSPDGVSYMSVARSLISHGELKRLGSPHVRYAPGYPVLISPAFWFGPRPFVVVQIIQWVYAVLLILGTYAWFARYAGRGAIWVTGLALLNAGFWDLFRQVSSELAFMPCLMWGSVLLAGVVQSPKSARAGVVLAGGILLIAAASAIRQAGALVVVGFALAMGIRVLRGEMGWGRAVIFSAALAICIAVVSCALIAFDHRGARAAGPAEIGYTDAFRAPDKSVVVQVTEGVRRQTAEIGRLLVPGMWKAHALQGGWKNINTWVFLLVCVPVAIGWWKFSWATADPLALAFPFYFALYVIYPFDSGTRFTVPMLPVIAASIWFALLPLGSRRTLVMLVLVIVQMGVAIGFWLNDAAHVRRRWQRWPAMEHVANEIPVEAKIIALRHWMGDEWMFLMCLTDRPVAPEMLGEPVTVDADWIVTAELEPDWPGFRAVSRVEGYKLETRIVPVTRAGSGIIGRKGS